MNSNFNRLKALVFCLILCVTTFPLSGCAKDGELIKTAKSGDFTYGVYSDHAEIVLYEGNGGKVDIPEKLGG